jgi:hypothetical protein
MSSTRPALADPKSTLLYPIAAVGGDSDDDGPCITVDRSEEGAICLRMNRAVADALRAHPNGIFILVSAGDNLKPNENPGELLVPVCLDRFVSDGATHQVLKRLRTGSGKKKAKEEANESEEEEEEDVEDSEEHERCPSRFKPIIDRLLKK